MRLDGRSLEEKEVLLRLRDIFREHAEQEISLDVLLADEQLTRRVRAFCAMSQLATSVTKKNGLFAVAVRGRPCRCG